MKTNRLINYHFRIFNHYANKFCQFEDDCNYVNGPASMDVIRKIRYSDLKQLYNNYRVITTETKKFRYYGKNYKKSRVKAR